MSRVSVSTIPAFPAAIFAASLGLGALLAAVNAAPAQAYDDDVEEVCWEWDNGHVECQSIGNLTAECEKVDPEFETDQCQGLLQSRRPFGLTDTTFERGKDKYHRDDNGGKDREPHGGDNNDGGNSGGGSAGGGSGPNF